MKRLKFSLIGVALAGTLVGCMSAQPNGGSQNGQAEDEIQFLRKKPSDAPNMTAILEGQLVLHEKCLYIQNGDSEGAHAAIWPYEFSLAIQEDTVQILDGDNEVVAQVGQQIRVSGGEATQLSPEEYEASFIGNTQCLAPYWITNADVEVITP